MCMVNGTRTRHNLLCASLRVSLFTTIHPLVNSTLHLGLLNFKTKHVIIISRNRDSVKSIGEFFGRNNTAKMTWTEFLKIETRYDARVTPSDAQMI